MKDLVLPFLGVILFIAVVGYFSGNFSKFGLPKSPEPTAVTVTIKGNTIQAEVADTSQEREKGLSGRESLCSTCGMLFDFTNETNHKPNFWMKDMQFPLDIIWIGEDQKIDKIDANVPAPEAGANTSDLPLYSPKASVNYVLEVNANYAEQNGIVSGDMVEINSN